MEHLNQLVSFWGAIASIVALTLTMLCGVFGFYKWGRKQREQEFAKLAELRSTIKERARAATTQGKRMDLFVYYQSLLSHRRFSQTLREIHAGFAHVLSIVLLIPILLQDANADYYLDHLFPVTPSFRKFSTYSYCGLMLVLFVLNIWIRYLLSAERKRLYESATGLTDELESYLLKNNG